MKERRDDGRERGGKREGREGRSGREKGLYVQSFRRFFKIKVGKGFWFLEGVDEMCQGIGDRKQMGGGEAGRVKQYMSIEQLELGGKVGVLGLVS